MSLHLRQLWSYGPSGLEIARWSQLTHLCTSATTTQVRIWRKFILGFSLTVRDCRRARGAYQVRQEGRNLCRGCRTDVTLVAAAAKVAVDNALRDEQGADVREMNSFNG